MKLLKLHDLYFKPFITEEEISKVVNKLAQEVSNDIDKSEIPLFIAILNGSAIFAADFIRKYSGICEISFVKLSSYSGTSSTEQVTELIGLNEDISGRTVVILEDIIDTGNTLLKIYDIFKNKNVKQLKIATLLFKPTVYKKELPIDYIGKNIEDKFVVGYGLDYDGIGRSLPDIYQLTPNPKMKNIILFGPPGSGKGTQAEILKDKYNLVHISTGDVFRRNIKGQTELGKLANSYIIEGNLVPDEVTINMLKEEVENHPEASGFMFDGFPRTQPQAEALDAFLAEKGEGISGVVSLECDDNVLIERIIKRGETSGRTDDVDESKIRHRFTEYHSKTSVLVNFYKNQNIYFGVNGIGSVEEITERMSKVIDKL